MTTQSKLDEMMRIAEGATPGPWRWMSRNTLVGNHGHRPVVLTSDSEMLIREKESGRLVELTTSENDPTYISTFHPRTVIALLQALGEAREALGRVNLSVITIKEGSMVTPKMNELGIIEYTGKPPSVGSSFVNDALIRIDELLMGGE